MLDVELAVVASDIRLKLIPMMGLCLNEKHVSLAGDRRAQVIFDSRRDPASELNELAL